MNSQAHAISKFSPIALFVFDRPEHTRKTIESLINNVESIQSDLIIFSDAGKSSSQKFAVEMVRQYLRGIQGFRSITVHYREYNYGLSKSILEGVTDTLKMYGRIIVLEDDMVTSPFFLSYMNQALDLYSGDNDVASIHGYLYPIKYSLPESFFMRGADCWGWGTWSRAWNHLRLDGAALLLELRQKKLIKAFDLEGDYPYTRMLKDQIAGRNNSWAIRWHASCFLRGMLTLYPGRSLVHNIGHDSTGTHCINREAHDVVPSLTPINLKIIDITPSKIGHRAVREYLRDVLRPHPFRVRVINVMKRVLWRMIK